MTAQFMSQPYMNYMMTNYAEMWAQTQQQMLEAINQQSTASDVPPVTAAADTAAAALADHAPAVADPVPAAPAANVAPANNQPGEWVHLMLCFTQVTIFTIEYLCCIWW